MKKNKDGSGQNMNNWTQRNKQEYEEETGQIQEQKHEQEIGEINKNVKKTKDENNDN